CGGAEADAEVIALLVRALEAAGLDDFQVDVGHVGVARGVLEWAALPEGGAERAARLVAKKDRSGLEALLGELGARPEAGSAVLALVGTYGAPAVLDEAARAIPAPAALLA